MTKKELAAKVAAACSGTEAHGTPAAVVEEVITATLGVIKDVVYCGGEVTLRGFGTFGTFGHKNRKAKTARNISTGEPVHVPARKVVSFKPAADFNVAQD